MDKVKIFNDFFMGRVHRRARKVQNAVHAMSTRLDVFKTKNVIKIIALTGLEIFHI